MFSALSTAKVNKVISELNDLKITPATYVLGVSIGAPLVQNGSDSDVVVAVVCHIHRKNVCHKQKG
jgi:hypothetical protein